MSSTASSDKSPRQSPPPTDGQVTSWPPAAEKSIFELLDAATLACISVNKEGHVTGWNNGAEQLFGWSNDEIMDQPIQERLSISSPESLAGREAEAVGKEGNLLELKIWGTELGGNTSGSMLLAADIREKKFLERALIEAAEREQRRIGQELHDHLCQHLLGAAFAAKALAGALDREGSSHAPELHDLARLINDSVSQARDISRGLHPVELDSAGLMSALHELANRASHTVPCTFQCRETILIGNPQIALNAYRIAQDAVSHALQNSGAKKIQIRLFNEDDSICLEIKDDGSREGELTSNPEGTAARTLQYRAQAMHAQLFIDFDSEKGTRTICLFPKAHE
jgi:PAS domain S-box-containing protein